MRTVLAKGLRLVCSRCFVNKEKKRDLQTVFSEGEFHW